MGKTGKDISACNTTMLLASEKAHGSIMLLVDFGAYEYIAYQRDWLHDVVDVRGKQVLLGNKAATRPTHEGKKKLLATKGTGRTEAHIILKK